MNVKNTFGVVGDFLGGIAATLGGLVSVGILSQVVFGNGWLGIDIVGNISGLVNTFLAGGVTGLVTLIIIGSLWD